MLNPKVFAVQWQNGNCVLIDQTRIPSEEVFLNFDDYRGVVDAIQRLVVRGAPAIGVAGAYAVVLAANEALAKGEGNATGGAFFQKALLEIADARPTAVNLRWAVEKMKAKLSGRALSKSVVAELLAEAQLIQEEDIASNRTMAQLGAALFTKPMEVITYCNTGDLATGGIGTAFGVIHQGYLNNKVTHVYPCETRPVGQGLRLTVWELQKNGIPLTLICDNMAGLTMATGRVGAVLVGADRVAANGDAANKVGTYGLAVMANYHKIPFYVVAPTSTFDMSIESGLQIPIEERSPDEILKVLGSNQHRTTVKVKNPSFDVTPRELITAIVCEKGVITSPSRERVSAVVNQAQGLP